MKSMLVLIASPALEEAIIDWLLIHPDISGFTSNRGYGHGGGHNLSVAEQVTGRHNQLMFWIELDQEKAATIISLLKADFAGSHIHYWQLPLIESGLVD